MTADHNNRQDGQNARFDFGSVKKKVAQVNRNGPREGVFFIYIFFLIWNPACFNGVRAITAYLDRDRKKSVDFMKPFPPPPSPPPEDYEYTLTQKRKMQQSKIQAFFLAYAAKKPSFISLAVKDFGFIYHTKRFGKGPGIEGWKRLIDVITRRKVASTLAPSWLTSNVTSKSL